MTSDEPSENRYGAYRQKALDHYGIECQNCGWTPEGEAQRHKLHVHHETPRAEGGPDSLDNLTVLCRDCHLAEHSLSEYSHELVGRLTRTLADALSHKTDGFSDRVGRRVRLDSVTQLEGTAPAEQDARPLLAGADDGPAVTVEAPTAEDLPNADRDRYAIVEGVLDGDHYDEYFVDPGKPYLQMCSCYNHSGGFRRARHICTHTGATIVRRAVGIAAAHGEERALRYVKAVGEELDEKAGDFVLTTNLVTDTIDALDIADEFSESWAERAERQAGQMTQYGREWKAFGGECAGCEISITADGFRCTAECDQSWGREDKWPCPGKLAAYIHNESGNTTVAPSFDAGQLFESSPGFGVFEAGQTLVATEIDEELATVSFRTLIGDSTETTVTFGEVTDAILNGRLDATSESDVLGWGLRFATDENDVPMTVAPDIDELVMQAKASVHPDVEAGDLLYVVGSDDTERELAVHHVGPDVRLTIDYETAIAAIRTKNIVKYNSDLGGWGLRVVTTDEGIPRFVAPDLPTNAVMQAETDLTGLHEGACACAVEADDESRTLILERIPEGERIGMPYSEAVDAIRNYELTKNFPDDAGFVIIVELEDGRVGIRSPYAAKDDIKSLDRDETGRRWDPDESLWTAKPGTLEAVIDGLNERGWETYIRGDG